VLNGKWLRIHAEPGVRPRFVKHEAPDVHMLYTSGAWCITRRADPQRIELLAEAPSTALHPNTVGTSAWMVNVQGVRRPCSAFKVVCCGLNTEQVGPCNPIRHAACLRV
jgi:hypothetical protein